MLRPNHPCGRDQLPSIYHIGTIIWWGFWDNIRSDGPPPALSLDALSLENPNETTTITHGYRPYCNHVVVSNRRTWLWHKKAKHVNIRLSGPTNEPFLGLPTKTWSISSSFPRPPVSAVAQTLFSKFPPFPSPNEPPAPVGLAGSWLDLAYTEKYPLRASGLTLVVSLCACLSAFRGKARWGGRFLLKRLPSRKEWGVLWSGLK